MSQLVIYQLTTVLKSVRQYILQYIIARVSDELVRCVLCSVHLPITIDYIVRSFVRVYFKIMNVVCVNATGKW